MKHFASVLLFMVFSAHAAFGAVAGFYPSVVNIDRAVDPTTFTLNVVIEATEAEWFDSIDMLIGSDDLWLVDFSLSSVIYCYRIPPSACLPSPNDEVYPSGFLYGSFGWVESTPFDLGTLTIDTAGVSVGDGYTVMVDWERDGGMSMVGGEPLFGVAIINITPEPATLTLLGVAGIALVQPRRKTG